MIEIHSLRRLGQTFDIPCVVFLAAPHLGMEDQHLATLFGDELSKEGAQELRHNSTVLQELNEDYIRLWGEVYTLTCYESRETPLQRKVRERTHPSVF